MRLAQTFNLSLGGLAPLALAVALGRGLYARLAGLALLLLGLLEARLDVVEALPGLCGHLALGVERFLRLGPHRLGLGD